MADDEFTFSELRKVQKEERRSEELNELDSDFILKVADYLKRKKEISNNEREYKNAKRVFRKILSLREDKIVKNARLSLKSNIKASELNMLPREQELFREIKEKFNEHRDRIQEVTNEHQGKNNTKNLQETNETENNEIEEDKEQNNTENNKEDENEEVEEGYDLVEITSEVPEFMGTDLEAYGPFEEGERAKLPEDNAEILVNRGNAKQMS